MASTLLAQRVFRIAAVGVVALLFGVAAFVVAEDQCDGNPGGPLCARGTPVSAIETSIDAATVSPSLAKESSHEGEVSISATVTPAGVNATSADTQVSNQPEAGMAKLGLALLMLVSALIWLLTMTKFAIDGSLPARLALWGLLPEAYAAISVGAVYHLLRLKTGTTPVIILQNCVTDDGAVKLVEAMDKFGDKADLQVIELPHNPQLGIAGLEAIMESVMRPESKVVELDFSYNPQLGNKAVQLLKGAVASKTSKLQVLKLADIGASQDSMRDLATAVGRSKLRTLDLGWNSMKGGGEILAEAMEAPILEELVLTCCDLSPDDVTLIGEQLQYTSIRSLQLGGNRFGSEGVERLAEFLPKCSVDELGLEAVGLENGCPGLSALASAWVQRPFSRLRIHSNRMTNEEIATFVRTLKSMQV